MTYPAVLEIELPDRVGRWRPLFHWVLAIPHLVVMNVLSLVTEIVAIIAWFAIVFTGNMPPGLANVICMTQRFQARVATFITGLHEQYPPFAFDSSAADPGGYLARVELAPTLTGRNRLTVGLRILWVIPAAIVTTLIGFIAGVCWLIGAFAVLFTGAWPAGLQAWVLKGIRANLRLGAYLWLLTDEYPPMNFD